MHVYTHAVVNTELSVHQQVRPLHNYYGNISYNVQCMSLIQSHIIKMTLNLQYIPIWSVIMNFCYADIEITRTMCTMSCTCTCTMYHVMYMYMHEYSKC